MYRLMILISFLLTITTTSLAAEPCKNKWERVLQNNDIPPKYMILVGLCDSSLKKQIRVLIQNNKHLDYKVARKEFFSHLDNEDGEVCSVYSDLCMKTKGIPNPNVMNCEHSWPQSLGAVGVAKSDLHHLFPVESRLNSKRGNKPFCEVADISWDKEGSYYGKSEKGTSCFEPPSRHKGNLSRAMLYFSIRYAKPIDSEQESFFKKWSKEDAVTSKEEKRNYEIERFQNNRNPFVDIPDLADLISDF